MKTFTLPLLAAVALGAITLGNASAMPFSANHEAAVLDESLVHNVRVVCNRHGNCWNTDRSRSVHRSYSTDYYNRPGYYDRPGHYAEPGYGYYGGPHVGVGIGPFGVGIY